MQPSPLPTDAELATALGRLFELCPLASCVIDPGTGSVLRVNPAFAALLGWSAGELRQPAAGGVHPWVAAADLDRYLERIAAEPSFTEHPARVRTRDGRTLQVALSADPCAAAGRSLVLATLREPGGTERAQRHAERVLEHADTGIALARDGRFELVNRRFETTLGWPAGGLLGQPAGVIWPTAAAYDDDARRWQGEPGGATVELERPLRRHDGDLAWCRLRATPAEPARPQAGTIFVLEDVAAVRRAADELAVARDRAEAAGRSRGAFLASLGHEIRAPLASLMGLVRLALQRGTPRERQQSYLRHIRESAEALDAVLSDAIDLSSLEAGTLPIDACPFDLRDLVFTLAERHSALATPRGLTTRVRFAGEVPDRVIGDPRRLRQILSNYLSNALRYTSTGGFRLGVTRGQGGADHVRVEVRDTGTGIAPEVLGRLFDGQGEHAAGATSRHGSAGVGLLICRRLATLMGGEVGVDSVPGQGSTFWVELPLPAAPANATVPAAPAAQAPRGDAQRPVAAQPARGSIAGAPPAGAAAGSPLSAQTPRPAWPGPVDWPAVDPVPLPALEAVPLSQPVPVPGLEPTPLAALDRGPLPSPELAQVPMLDTVPLPELDPVAPPAENLDQVPMLHTVPLPELDTLPWSAPDLGRAPVLHTGPRADFDPRPWVTRDLEQDPVPPTAPLPVPDRLPSSARERGPSPWPVPGSSGDPESAPWSAPAVRRAPARLGLGSVPAPLDRTAADPATGAAPGAPAPATGAGPMLPAAIDLLGLRLLVVEDDEAHRQAIEAALRAWGADAVAVPDGETAVDRLDRPGHGFDAVLMDLQLPGMSGHETAHALRRRWTPRELPVIAMSASALVSEREQSLLHGMNDLIDKPLDPTQLKRALRTWVTGREPAGRY